LLSLVVVEVHRPLVISEILRTYEVTIPHTIDCEQEVVLGKLLGAVRTGEGFGWWYEVVDMPVLGRVIRYCQFEREILGYDEFRIRVEIE
jgi:hypothetical protein